jgi:hypothetical protein
MRVVGPLKDNPLGSLEKERMFFFEKKNQKTFAYLARGGGWVRDSRIEVFCFFFFEKRSTCFRCLALFSPSAHGREGVRFGLIV